MALQSKNVDRWERLYLGVGLAWAARVIWEYAPAFAFPIIVILEGARRMQARRPALSANIWPLALLLAAIFLYLTWRQIKTFRGYRARLRKAKGSPEYRDLTLSAKASTLAFIRIGFIYGGAVLLLEIAATVLSSS